MELNLAVFNNFPILETERIILREIRVSDAKQILEMRSNNRVNQFIPRKPLEILEDAEALAQRTSDAFKNQLAIGWAGQRKGGTEIIGTCRFNSIDFANLRAEIGGELATDHWGKMLAFEAVDAIVDFGLNSLNLQTIEAKASPLNRGAIAILEKLGFVKEAHFKNRVYFNGVFSDMAVYTRHKS
jgi:ribosomal-protein-alanine N-acetyltransferase